MVHHRLLRGSDCFLSFGLLLLNLMLVLHEAETESENGQSTEQEESEDMTRIIGNAIKVL